MTSNKENPTPRKTETGEQAQQVFERPHQASYFIPGHVEGCPVQFLLDSSCTTNLLGKQVFDRLPERIRSQKEEYARHGQDILWHPPNRQAISPLKTQEVFIISQISKDAILGMPFLVEHQCTMEFRKSVLQLEGQELKCADCQGRLLSSNIQVVR